MNKNKLLPYAVFITILLLISVQNVISQNPAGKIRVKIVDKATRQALSGATLEINDLSGRIMESDHQGKYEIPNLPPGEYTVSASMTGYHKLTVNNVRVIDGLVTTIIFELTEREIESFPEIEYSAARQLIYREKTSKIAAISGDELVDLPINDLMDLLRTQSDISVLSGTPYEKSGYDTRGLDDIHMRGGRHNEIAYLIDGIAVSNPLFGGFPVQIDNFSIEQVNIASGGFDASGGNKLSGIVKISTRDGGNKYSGQIQYNSSRPFGIDAFAPLEGEARNMQRVQFSFSGPIPRYNKMSFFISGELSESAAESYEFDDVIWDEVRDINGDGLPDYPTSMELMRAYANSGKLLVSSAEAEETMSPASIANAYGRWINPLDIYEGWKGFGFRNSLSFNSKLTYRLNPKMKVSVSLAHSQVYSQPITDQLSYIYHWPVGRFMYINPPNLNENIQPAQFLGAGNISYNQTGMAGRSVNFRHSQRFTVNWTHNISGKSYYSASNQWFRQQRKTRQLMDYSKKFSSSWNTYSPDWNNIKTKNEYNFSGDRYYDPWEGRFRMQGDGAYYEGDGSITNTTRFDYTSRFRKSHEIKTGIEFIYHDISREDYQSSSLLDRSPTIYSVHPKEGSLYLMDKIDFLSIILNLGLRIDYYDADDLSWIIPLDPLSHGLEPPPPDFVHKDWVENDSKYRFSPRLGVALPITDSSVLHFNFGHFYQIANYRDMYRAFSKNRNPKEAILFSRLIGNPLLKPEKSIQFEFGMQQQLNRNLALNINLWLKETTNQVGSLLVPLYPDWNYNSFSYSIFMSNNFGSVKGFDINLTKRYSNYFSAVFDYTWSKSMVLMHTSWDGYWDGNTIDSMPKREQIANWDQPHVIRARFNFSLPDDFGAEFYGYKPLSSFGLSLIYYGESGRLYTPTTQSGSIMETNSGRWPFYHRLDGRFRKTVRFFDLRTQLFVNITNIFNRKNAVTGYTETGSPSDPGTTYGSASGTYYDAAITTNFDMGRGIDFGLRIRF